MEFVYDRDCGFCSRVVAYFGSRTHDVTFVPSYQYRRPTSVDLERTALAVVDGREYAEHLAISQLLRRARGAWPIIGRALALPIIAPLARRVYRWVAANRKATVCKIASK
ncbi:putative DCC family thiol-disulfide oxidoreductase YuxK [Arcanobacterium wilhelmae]|uniref:DCC family thiol-disulfide oxidoreductase YuxK n=1 Tax=Arcanobacterium wilhelmae TaxID=1803177 RepID=A0ABT9N9H4_9ACTO|nr:DCC1-like thiol-disulfide oxidoreductase family protein [Arcanobacterium wilhelmae]MDP9800353.1 putative DCC family thiol-disulfide oxidoreductase YuxK [Arcanobacterium wilhelmae]WFN89789.1 DCC1-like thiol-disulfide oxidoreductase family protein [Arcanobacterium wilhelmae]